ncbi:MAG: hypothetical protein IJ681_05040 [Bacteroidales bacterium]|nr:hypothetical protein [Bacteroidales bacterium]
MRKLLIYSAVIIICTATADFLTGRLGKYFTEQLPEYGDNLITKPNYALQHAKADILILGSSRAEHHYDTRIFQLQFPDTEIYNAGQHNQGMNYALAVLKSCIERKTPKIVFLDCEPEVLSEEKTAANTTLKTFYSVNNNVKSVLNETLKDKIVLKSGFYKYNGVILKLFLDSRLPKSEDTLKGFESLKGSLDTSKLKYEQPEFTSVISKAEKDFKEIISLCKKHNIKLYVVISPYYYHQNEMSLPYVRLSEICSKKNVSFSDYMNNSFFDSQPQLFHDINHLNEKGAILFTYRLLYDLHLTQY